jgi:hypothetical protein
MLKTLRQLHFSVTIGTFMILVDAVPAICAPFTHALTDRPNAQEERQQRFAALECQNELVFALVNFYPDRTLLLSWGTGDILKEIDIPVQRIADTQREVFAGERIRLEVSLNPHLPSTTPREGRLQVKDHPPWKGLRCLLYGPD